MNPDLEIFGFVLLGLAVVWTLAHFGYRYYREMVDAEESRHAAEGKH